MKTVFCLFALLSVVVHAEAPAHNLEQEYEELLLTQREAKNWTPYQKALYTVTALNGLPLDLRAHPRDFHNLGQILTRATSDNPIVFGKCTLSHIHHFEGTYEQGEGWEFDLLHPSFGAEPVRYRLGFEDKKGLPIANDPPAIKSEDNKWTVVIPGVGTEVVSLSTDDLTKLEDSMRSIKIQAPKAFQAFTQNLIKKDKKSETAHYSFSAMNTHNKLPPNNIFMSLELTKDLKTKKEKMKLTELSFSPNAETSPISCK